jgi:two-component system, chemotaxis family, chemotaxis protein CheY
MKILIVEDDFTTRFLTQEMLRSYGQVHIAVNGVEAVEAVKMALDSKEPYNLICLDIMMPGMDGQQALKEIRALEEARGILSSEGAKVLMTTALSDMENKFKSFSSLCDGYLTKPISREQLINELRNLGLIP